MGIGTMGGEKMAVRSGRLQKRHAASCLRVLGKNDDKTGD